MAAQTVSGTYKQVKPAFEAVVNTLPTITKSLDEMSAALSGISQQTLALGQLSELVAGFSQLSNEYQAFHTGLQSYFDGVTQLSGGYLEFHTGLDEFSSGIDELANGAYELSDGTSQLNTEAAKIPDTIEGEIDNMLSSFIGTEFEPISFTSSDNMAPDFVQFVLKCDSIQKSEAPKITENETENNETFWDRLVALFK